jgi:anti-sigma B factor antagonist/stage II sporulation protein AA (anti-sigma F factor antagonist)
MWNHRKIDERDRVRIAIETIARTDDRRDPGDFPAQADALPRLRVQTIERAAILRFEGAEILFEESAVRAVSEQLHRLVEEGHIRLLVNFGGVRYLSSDVLGILAAVHKKIDPARGRIQLCGLNPLLQDMLRITHLDRVLDVCTDEAEALELLAY